ncbi:MAG: SprT-like domain-containing protein [Anaeroplasmataceae bacterium]|nr:SprT-like domain-containing protein [Anaeroplasmataceae bacterium]
MKIKDITLKSSREIEVLESAINFLNKNLFDNKLSNIKVTIQPDNNTKNLTYGWACSQIWSNGKIKAHELNITANSLKRPFSEIWITLVHELIHIYAFCTGDPSGATSRQGRYHGKKFKELCDQFFLITEKEQTIGYITPHQKMMKEQKEIFMKFKKSCKANLGLLFKYQRVMYEKISKPKTSTTSKYVCPCCELSFKAKKGLNLICGECEQKLEEIEG